MTEQPRVQTGGAEQRMIEDLQSRVAELEDELFKQGRMNQAPCFVCGYNGPNYYQPDVHKCAERHHRLLK